MNFKNNSGRTVSAPNGPDFRQFLLTVRRALIMIVAAIEEMYPDLKQ